MKRFLRSFLSLVAVVGVVIALWPVGQNAYAWWNQRALRSAWNEEARSKSSTPRRRITQNPIKNKQVEPDEAYKSQQAALRKLKEEYPWPPTRLIIPSIGLDVVVLQGFDDATLKRAPGHHPPSALPGQPGNCIIAGHRNVYGGWFYQVPNLEPGTEIKLRTPDETFTYKVLLTKTASAMDTTLFQPAPPGTPPRLMLLTCTLPHSPDRLITIAEVDQSVSPY